MDGKQILKIAAAILIPGGSIYLGIWAYKNYFGKNKQFPVGASKVAAPAASAASVLNPSESSLFSSALATTRAQVFSSGSFNSLSAIKRLDLTSAFDQLKNDETKKAEIIAAARANSTDLQTEILNALKVAEFFATKAGR